MAQDYQKLVIEGRIGRVSELHQTKGGTSVINVSIAVHRDQWEGGERASEMKTLWHDISFWGKTADYVANYGREGRRVLVEAEDVEPEIYQPEGKPASVKIKARGTFVKFMDPRETEQAQEAMEATLP